MAEAAKPKRPKTGGRVPGRRYTPAPPNSFGEGHWPHKDFSDVQPQDLQDSLVWWQDICLDIRDQRQTLGVETKAVAAAIGVVPNTIQNLEDGEWVHATVLLRTCSVLGLEVWQAVEVERRSRPPRRRSQGKKRPGERDDAVQ